MNPIVTGADIFRSQRVLNAAEIHGLDTTPILAVPSVLGKVILPLFILMKYTAGSEVWTVATGAAAALYYGPAATGTTIAFNPLFATFFSDFFSNGITTSQSGVGATTPGYGSDLATSISTPVFLVATTPGFDTGAALTATVDPAHKGLLYALNDTGNITDGDGTAVYTVTGVGAGGLVTTVTVTGGAGLVTGASFATTVLTGSGDGTLKLAITSITPLGNGTVEIDVIYTLI